MVLEEAIKRVEDDLGRVQRVVELNQRVLGEVMKDEPLPTSLEKISENLRSARDLGQHNDVKAAERLLGHADDAVRSLRQWLAVTDLGISPFNLRSFLEKNPLPRDDHAALIRYFLAKHPHAENDRDKVDYLLTGYLVPSGSGETALPEAAPLRDAVEELLAGRGGQPLSAAAEVMVHEMESLVARVADFGDFDQLVQARMVERARALKTNLGEEFYHPHVLPTVLRFNVSFRRHFDRLLNEQLQSVRENTRQALDEARTLVGAVQAAYEARELSHGRGTPAAAGGEQPEAESSERVGRPLDVVDERPPIDRLVRVGQAAPKEKELRGIVSRLARVVEKLTPEQAAAEKVTLPLRQGQIELTTWERESFTTAASRTAPESTRTIQYAVAVVAWIEEELTRYQQTRHDRYLWKTHLDLLSYAVVRSLDLLKTINDLIRVEAPEAEAVWFPELLQTALRLGAMLERVAPVFEQPAAA